MRQKIEPRFLLVSVQRTGTRFVQRLFQGAGIKTAQIHAAATRAPQIDGWLEKNEREDLPIIVPMRHPLSVAMSWRVRSDPLEGMFEQFSYLAEICERSRTLFLPVDHPEREHYLANMAKTIQKLLITDWQPYGHKDGDAPRFSGGELDDIAELCGHPLISQFYPDVVPHGT